MNTNHNEQPGRVYPASCRVTVMLPPLDGGIVEKSTRMLVGSLPPASVAKSKQSGIKLWPNMLGKS